MNNQQSEDKVCLLCEKVERWLLRIALVALLAIGLGKLLWVEIGQLIEPSDSAAERRGIRHVEITQAR